LLAEQAAAASVAVESAATAVTVDRPSATFAVAAAKIRAGKVAEIAHPVHGAIGFTHERSLHRLTRRLWPWRDEFGNESYCSRPLGRQIGPAPTRCGRPSPPGELLAWSGREHGQRIEVPQRSSTRAERLNAAWLRAGAEMGLNALSDRTFASSRRPWRSRTGHSRRLAQAFVAQNRLVSQSFR
jgi:hypothetical protein